MTSLRIAVGGNGRAEQKLYEARLREEEIKYGIPVELKSYQAMESLLFDLGDLPLCHQLDILFLVAEPAEIAGELRVALQARKCGYPGLIVMIGRDHPGSGITQLFDASVFNYILFDDPPERFDKVFWGAYKAVMENHAEYMVFASGGEHIQIPVESIGYFEVHDHIITVHYDNKSFDFISTLSRLENHLFGRKFQRIHRSFLVSLTHVRHLSFYSILLNDGTTVPIGRGYYQRTKSACDSVGNCAMQRRKGTSLQSI